VSGAAVAAQSPAVKGNPVKFSGCVTPGTEQGSFLLTNVKRTDGAADTNTIYWLDSARKLDGHAGHQVEVTGIISDVSDGKVKTKTDPKKDTDKIEVKKGGESVTANVPAQPVGTTAKKTTTDEPRALLKLKVKSLKMLSSSCSTH
jgi:hypothetical protein